MNAEYDINDLDAKLITRAFRNVSFSPERRARSEQSDYVNHMQDLYNRLAPFVTPENEEEMQADLIRYKEGYLKRLNAYYLSQGRAASSMIVGGSNFPVARMEKINISIDNKLKDLLEYSKRAQNYLDRKYNPNRKTAVLSNDKNAIDKLQDKLNKAEQKQVMMISANKIIRKKNLTDEQKIEELIKIEGITEEIAQKLLQPDYMGRCGYLYYETSNNNAEIRRLKSRIDSLSEMKEKPAHEYLFEGGKIVENSEEMRLQIFFDDKPNEEVRNKLKHNGFKWAPTQKAWQRVLNNAAIYAAKNLLLNGE